MKKLGIIRFLIGLLLTSQIYAHTQKELEMNLLREVSLGNLDGVKKAIEDGASIEAKGENKKTPLILAVEKKNRDIVEYLLDKKADLSAQDNNGQTPLHKSSLNSDTSIMALLIQAGANLEAQTKKGATPLHFAVYANNIAGVAFLVEQGAKVNASNKEGMIPLHISMKNIGNEVPRYLLSHGANFTIETKNGYRAIHYAMAHEYGEKKVELLMMRGETLRIKKEKGSNLLHLACTRGLMDFVDEILNHLEEEDRLSAVINKQDQLGNTPLHYACLSANVELAKRLQEKGANPFILNNKLEKPWDLLEKRKNKILHDGNDSFYDEFYDVSHTPFQKWIRGLYRR
jgi:ankyrin repeat protein